MASSIELKLNASDWELILEGLEFLKSKSFSAEIMAGVLNTMLLSDKMSITDQLKFKTKEQEKKERRDKEQRELTTKVELLKAKVLLMRESGQLYGLGEDKKIKQWKYSC